MRTLRTARFAGRFGFAVDPAIGLAASTREIHEALRHKVTRERYGQEVHKMFGTLCRFWCFSFVCACVAEKDAVFSLTLLDEWGLLPIVFQLPSDEDKKFETKLADDYLAKQRAGLPEPPYLSVLRPCERNPHLGGRCAAVTCLQLCAVPSL